MLWGRFPFCFYAGLWNNWSRDCFHYVRASLVHVHTGTGCWEFVICYMSCNQYNTCNKSWYLSFTAQSINSRSLEIWDLAEVLIFWKYKFKLSFWHPSEEITVRWVQSLVLQTNCFSNQNKSIDGATWWNHDCELVSAGEEMGNWSDVNVQIKYKIKFYKKLYILYI